MLEVVTCPSAARISPFSTATGVPAGAVALIVTQPVRFCPKS